MSHQGKLLVISLDGFRYDYLDLATLQGYDISAFEHIWDRGFRVHRVENHFTTRTAPNHVSIVTGRYEESHGVIDNHFFDPLLKRVYKLSRNATFWPNPDVEPIWVTAEESSIKSGVINWPGSNSVIKGVRPSKFYPSYNTSVSFRSRINSILDWFTNDNISLGLVYYHEPDMIGHKTGAQSTLVLEKIAELNSDIEYLLKRLNKLQQLYSALNIIVTSDHGMTNVSRERVIVLNDYLTDELYTAYGGGAKVLWRLWPKENVSVDSLYYKLIGRHSMMYVYRKHDLPKRLFYSLNYRIAPLVVYAEIGWLIVKDRGVINDIERLGDHGYDPMWSDMSPFLLAAGPGFITMPNRTMLPSLQMVDIYPMMCHLLGITNPAAHNGSLSRISHLLLHPPHLDASTEFITYNIFGKSKAVNAVGVIFLILFSIITGVTFTMAACLHYFVPKRKIPATNMAVQRTVRQRSGNPAARSSNVLKGNTSVALDTRNQNPAKNPYSHELLLPRSDDESEEMTVLDSRQVDDATLLQLLREPQH